MLVSDIPPETLHLDAQWGRAVICRLAPPSLPSKQYWAAERTKALFLPLSGPKALGVSHPDATDILAGRRKPHPRHWLALAKLAGASVRVAWTPKIRQPVRRLSLSDKAVTRQLDHFCQISEWLMSTYVIRAESLNPSRLLITDARIPFRALPSSRRF